MGRIRILPDNVANKIAAGEVVERPASVVKELLENSLDSGAARVRIEVEAGGKKRIHVVDDGCGMVRDDALLAFERHATSKLRSADDLLSIATLGFRGEALPAIGAVSRLLLETHSPEEREGTRIEIAGGKLIAVEEAGLPAGTSIVVSDLFYNTPARRKFLRAEQTELSHISSLVTHYALAYPEKSFTLRTMTGDLVNVTPAQSLRDRVFQLLGPETLEEMIEFGPLRRDLDAPAESSDEEPEKPAITFRGFLSRPQIQKLNRNSIYLFVNQRVVRDRVLLHAIQEAYRNLIATHCFPVALLFLEMPPGEVDVNVHPSKVEVRFRHQTLVHDLVRDTLREALMAARPTPVFPAASAGAAASSAAQGRDASGADSPAARPAGDVFGLQEAPLPPQRFRFDLPPPEGAAGLREISDALYAPPPPAAPAANSEGTENFEISELRPLGQIRDSFIVASSAEGLWLIDQHAAHERILFEKFLFDRERGAVESQRLLMPYVLRLTPAQLSVWSTIQQEMELAGFEAEPFGQNTIAVKAAPASVRSDDLEKLLAELIESFERESRGYTGEDARNRIAASVSCHSAIKINTPLEPRKMEWLIAALAATRFPMSCAHGRPTILRYSLREILRGFHRI